MSNTEWYAQIETAKPWKAFNDYAKAVGKTFDFSHAGQPSGVDAQTSTKSLATANSGAIRGNSEPILNLTFLASVAAEAKSLFDSLPKAEQNRGQRCAGLPRKYPVMWMATPHSNSLMLEFRTVQSIPSNGLRNWKE